MGAPQTNFTTAVGRLVQGDPTFLNDKDMSGRKRMSKQDPTKEAPQCFFAVAIPKEIDPATGYPKHWAATTWGAVMWNEGHKGNAQAGQIKHFAWKLTDGDSTEFNQGTPPRRWCDMEGFPGHWVLKFSSGFVPKLYTLVGQPPRQPLLLQGEQCKMVSLGHYVEVNVNCQPNGDHSKPGIYLNGMMVCLVGYGVPITTGPNVEQANFGAAPLPAGASLTPPVGLSPPPAPGGSGTPAVPGAGAPPAPTGQTPVPPGTAGYSTSPPVPNPAFLAAGGHAAPPVPGAPVPPPAGPAPAAPAAPAAPMAGPRMTATATTTYAEYVKAGWSDQQLVDSGFMIR